MSQLFSQLQAEVLAAVFPIGVPDNLLSQANTFIVDGLIDLQRWVVCLQQNNTDVIPCCNTYFDCGLTVATLPQGRVKRVSTIANGDWCDRVYYVSASYGSLREESKKLIYTAPPERLDKPPLAQGVLYSGTESDDTVFSRARRGNYAIHRKRLYLLPWLQSNENLVVEWEGIKRDWTADDVVDYKEDVKLALKHYVRMMNACDFSNDDHVFSKYKVLYENQRADLMYECSEETRQRESEVVERYLPNADQLADDAP